MISLRRGTVTAVLERREGLARVEVDGAPCVAYPRLTGPLALGDEVLVEVTSFAGPCKTIAASFRGGKFKRISHKVFPGYSRAYVRVLRTGRLAVGQAVKLLDNGGPDARAGSRS